MHRQILAFLQNTQYNDNGNLRKKTNKEKLL